MKENWKPIAGIFVLCIFASVIYTRIIKNNEIFETFDGNFGMLPPQDRRFRPIGVVPMGTDPQCSSYKITSPPISDLFNISDMCHTAKEREQLEWNCFYRYDLQKKFLSDPNWARNVFNTNAPIFYKINSNRPRDCNICGSGK